MKHSKQFNDKMVKLYFDIEKHITTGGAPLSVKDIGKMLGIESSGGTQAYIKPLLESGLLRRLPFKARTITLGTKYPRVEWRKNEDAN